MAACWVAGLLGLDDQEIVVVVPPAVDDDVGKHIGPLVPALLGDWAEPDSLGLMPVSVVLAINIPAGKERLEVLGQFVGDGALVEVVLEEVYVVEYESSDALLEAGANLGCGDIWECHARPRVRASRLTASR